MTIDISDAKTYPPDAVKIILSYFRRLPQTITSKIQTNVIRYDIDVRCAIEDYVGPFKAAALYEEVISIFEQYELICYHSTKMLDKNMVLSEGLKTNEWDSYSEDIISTFKQLGLNEDDLILAMECIKHQYDFKYSSIGMGSQICFYSDLDLIDMEDSAGYEQFCENIGGETARWALKEQHPELYKYLKENGEAFIVKFKLPFSDMVDFDKECIVYQFIAYVAGMYFWNYNYSVHFDSKTKTCIPPNNILEIIPYTKEIDY